jgi:transposase
MAQNDKQLINITMTEREKERYNTILHLIQGEIVASMASKQLNLSVRQVQRVKKAVQKDGIQGIIHKNRGKPSNRRLDENVKNQVLRLIKKHYADFGPTLTSEKLLERHDVALSISCVRNLMTDAGRWKPKRRKAAREYRSWRPRKEQCGEMEQFDGSYHKWFEDRAPECCLLASIDDATGKPTRLEFSTNESVQSVFTFWDGYIQAWGKPVSIYLDKYSTYKINHPSAVDNSELLTQFQRAMRELDIRVISAHSPQAKGRIERLFDTLQDRLVKELRLRNISTPEAANIFLREEYIPAFNKKFSVVPAKAGNLHRPLSTTLTQQLPAILAVQSVRVVNNDFTIQFKNTWLQLNETQPTTVYKKDRVIIEQRLDGSVCIRLKGKYLYYTVLPQRPMKAHRIESVPLAALTIQKPTWKPPATHPWRQRILANTRHAQGQTISLT